MKASAPRPGLVPHKAAARMPAKTLAQSAPKCPLPTKAEALLPTLDKAAVVAPPAQAKSATANNAPVANPTAP